MKAHYTGMSCAAHAAAHASAGRRCATSEKKKGASMGALRSPDGVKRYFVKFAFADTDLSSVSVHTGVVFDEHAPLHVEND